MRRSSVDLPPAVQLFRRLGKTMVPRRGGTGYVPQGYGSPPGTQPTIRWPLPQSGTRLPSFFLPRKVVLTSSSTLGSGFSTGTVGERKPLNVRAWTCGCGSVHDRDHNAAKNILAAGRAERLNACGARVRPTAMSAQRGEAGTHRGSRPAAGSIDAKADQPASLTDFANRVRARPFTAKFSIYTAWLSRMMLVEVW